MPKNFNVVPKKFNLVPKNSIYCQEKIKISSKKIQNHAEKIQNSTKKAQKTTNRVDWILSEWVCESMITMFIASAKIQLLWATARLLVTRFNPYQPSWWVLPQGNEDVGSIQDFILLFFVWCESRELGNKGSSRIACITPVVETLSDRAALIILPNISDGAPLQKQPTALTFISRCQAFSYSNWHLISFPSVPCLLFFLRKWIFFVLSFVWHSLHLSISSCRNSEAVVCRCSVEKVFL